MGTSWTSLLAAPAGIAAVITLVLTLTKTSRLRKDEAVLRDGLKALDPDSVQHQVATSVHRSIMAQLLARHLTPPWRLAWPVGALLAILAINIQTGYLGANYIFENPTAGFNQVVSNVTGDGLSVIMAVPVSAISFPFIWNSLVRTLVLRAETALRFNQGQSVQAPLTLMQEVRRSQHQYDSTVALAQSSGHPGGKESIRGEWISLGKFIVSGLGPGLALTCLGLLIGYGLSDQELTRSLGRWVGPLVLLQAASIMLAIFNATQAWDQIGESALPRYHPLVSLETRSSKDIA